MNNIEIELEIGDLLIEEKSYIISKEYIAILELIVKTHYGLSQRDLLNKIDKSLRGKRGLQILNDL